MAAVQLETSFSVRLTILILVAKSKAAASQKTRMNKIRMELHSILADHIHKTSLEITDVQSQGIDEIRKREY